MSILAVKTSANKCFTTVKFLVVYKKNQMKETQQKTRKRDGMKSEQSSGRTTVLVKDHA